MVFAEQHEHCDFADFRTFLGDDLLYLAHHGLNSLCVMAHVKVDRAGLGNEVGLNFF